MAIKLNKQQINALARDLYENLNKQHNEDKRNFEQKLKKSPAIIKETNRIFKLLSQVPSNFSSHYRWSVSSIKDKLVTEESYKQFGSYNYKYSSKTISDKIILATVDATDLKSLKEQVLKQLK